MDFTQLNLDKEILEGIQRAGFTECTPVQEKCFAYTLTARDVTVQSQTGTGKTAAFLISIFNLMKTGALPRDKKALVIAPTRELAVQIEKDAQLLGGHLGISMGTFYGGVSYRPQEDLLSSGVQLMIGTPGRLLDLAKNRKFTFKDIRALVIDEADRLFDMGFLPDLRRMLRQMPPYHERVTMLFSATLSMRVKALAWDHMNNPVEIRIEPEKVTVDEVTQTLYHVGRHEKFSLLLGILNHVKPESAVIFTNTKHAAVMISKKLTLNGYNCGHLTGDMPQSKRLRTVERAKSGELKFLVATDVASRGLHIEDLPLVINYDLPEDPENYVHRIGRTARVGRQGKAVSLVGPDFVHALEAIEKYIHMEIAVDWAEDDMFMEDQSAGVPLRTETRSRQRGDRKPKERYRRKPAESHKGSTPRSDTRPRAKRKSPNRPAGAMDAPLTRGVSPEDRVAYYRKKYGENFKPDKG